MRGQTYLKHLSVGVFPLTMAVALTLIWFCADWMGLPTFTESQAWYSTYALQYGYFLLLLFVFIEGLYMVNFYFPGSVAIIFAIFLSDRTFWQLAEITSICWVAFMCAHVVNYYIGHQGIYRVFDALGGERALGGMKNWYDKYGFWTNFVLAFQPFFLAVSVVSMGISRQGLFKALTQVGIAMAISGPILTYFVATTVDEMIVSDSPTGFMFMVGIFYAWAAWAISMSYLNRDEGIV